MNLNLLGEEGNAYTSAHLLPAESIGGLIGYAKGTVTLTGCAVEDMTVNVTDKNDNGGTQFLIGGFIGYADALYTPYDAEGKWADNDYRGNGSVSIIGCTVSGMTVDKNGATGASVGGFLGGICKSATSKDGTTYSVTADIDDRSTFLQGFTALAMSQIPPTAIPRRGRSMPCPLPLSRMSPTRKTPRLEPRITNARSHRGGRVSVRLRFRALTNHAAKSCSGM